MLHKGFAAGSSPKEEWARVSCILVRQAKLSHGLEDDQQLHLVFKGWSDSSAKAGAAKGAAVELFFKPWSSLSCLTSILQTRAPSFLWAAPSQVPFVVCASRKTSLYVLHGCQHHPSVTASSDISTQISGERRLHGTGGSLSHHYLGSYQRALLAVCLAQFSAKRYREGMQGVMDLATAAQPLEALFRQELNLTPAEMRELAR